MSQIHKRFTDEQVKNLLGKYQRGEIKRKYIQPILGIGKTRFFELVNMLRKDDGKFSIRYARHSLTRGLNKYTEANLLKELKFEKKLIDDKAIPISRYNYSYIRDILQKKYKQTVSVPTIIKRAKKYGFYIERRKHKKMHDRQVLTDYVGELVQQDSSQHKWSPYSKDRWYLITAIDDYSRYMFYAKLVKKDISWEHIKAFEHVALTYGLAYRYYVDSHSIFRFVQGRDSLWRNHYKLTDDTETQWHKVLNDCGVKVTYALSPQAKGKIERPYGWLQDRIVRTCARENISDINKAQTILNKELHRYNYKQLHSTTEEVPYYRLKTALKNKKSLFREFAVKPPYQSIKDIFCFRTQRQINAYRRVFINNRAIEINGTPHETVEIRIYPLNKVLCELRFWCKGKLIDVRKIKMTDLKVSAFNF